MGVTRMFEGKGKTVKDAFLAMLDGLTEDGMLYKVQVFDGDWVVGVAPAAAGEL